MKPSIALLAPPISCVVTASNAGGILRKALMRP